MDELSERPVLEIQRVSAGYGGRSVVAGVDLAVRRGEIVGLLGANGSGKSTLIKAITGQIGLLSGKVTIAGADLSRRPEIAKAAFGLAVDADDLPMALTGRQYLELVASIRGCAPDAWRSGDLADRLHLRSWLDRTIKTFSLGGRAKLSICAALLGSPALVILDESLNGLDPLAAFEAKAVLAELAATGGVACLVATHLVETVPALCDRAVLLVDGALVRGWDKASLERSAGAPGGFEAEVIALLREDARRRASA